MGGGGGGTGWGGGREGGRPHELAGLGKGVESGSGHLARS